MSNSVTITTDLESVAGKTGLVVRPVSPQAINTLFSELEKYDSRERAETFDDLKEALNESRASIGAEPVFKNE